MDKELHQRINEAARDYAETAVVIQSVLREEYIKESIHDFKTGASFGYKEAIKMAKEWMKEQMGNDIFLCNGGWLTCKEFISNFETDMNKHLEE